MRGVDSETLSDDRTLEALRELYENGYHRFLRVAEAIVGEPEAAHDAVQDAFVRAVRGRGSFRGEGPLEGWVWRTVVNAARTARRNLSPAHIALHELGEGPSRNGDASNGELRATVAALPERQRLVVFLRYYADLDYQRIAEALEISIGTVGATLNQAHSALRAQLQEVVM